MRRWQRGVRLGIGVIGLGWSINRFRNRRRDLLTWTVLTSSSSLLANDLLGRQAPVTRIIDSVAQTTLGLGGKFAIPRVIRNAVDSLGAST